MTNIKNDEIVEDVVLNSEDNDINYNSESIVGVKNNGETNDENIIKNSTDEVLECNNGMLLCVYESERKWKERVDEYVGQRVNFPINFSEPECSQMMFLKGKRPVLVDELKCILMLYNVCLLYTSRCV